MSSFPSMVSIIDEAFIILTYKPTKMGTTSHVEKCSTQFQLLLFLIMLEKSFTFNVGFWDLSITPCICKLKIMIKIWRILWRRWIFTCKLNRPLFKIPISTYKQLVASQWNNFLFYIHLGSTQVKLKAWKVFELKSWQDMTTWKFTHVQFCTTISLKTFMILSGMMPMASIWMRTMLNIQCLKD